MPPLFLCFLLIPTLSDADRFAGVAGVAAQIDALVGKHWQENSIQPAASASDSEFLRRITLDLAGRTPTYGEARAFALDHDADKRTKAIRRLISGPEYPLQMGRVLDEVIQGKYAGDTEFLEYLRTVVAEHKPWDRIFREVLLGPWDTPPRQRANRFLVKRLNSLDDLTTDTARSFFGVNVSCAKCHDHPLVADWTQGHYFGMASFFNRTQEAGKGKQRNAAAIAEKPDGDVTFTTVKGEKRTAKLMFLSSKVIAEPAKTATSSRREQLVKAGLEERKFFSRSIVNRLWAYLMGRGLVQPVDQMHSANPPVIPGVLEWLADDLANHGYHLDRLVAALVSSRVYQLASTKSAAGESPNEKDFARATLRPLTPQQYAFSMLLVCGDGTFYDAAAPDARTHRYRQLEGDMSRLTKADLLDTRSDRFQSSTGEALFLSNHPEVQRLVTPAGKNLVARLAEMKDTKQLVETAIWSVLSRAPEEEESAYLVKWIDGRKQERTKACGEFLWALLTSAEFRFVH